MARKACNANSDDKIVFTTNPNKIINGLLSLESSTIIVFVGINQDDVSYKLWAQGGAEVVIIPENAQNGGLDLDYLEQQLGTYLHFLQEKLVPTLLWAILSQNNPLLLQSITRSLTFVSAARALPHP